MATVVNINTNYVGEVAGDIIGKAFAEADTIARGLITVNTNVTSKVYLRRIDVVSNPKDFACGFTPSGTVDLAERILEPKKLMIADEFCKEDFRQVWDQAKMGASAWNDNFEALDESKAFVAEVLGSVAEVTDEDIWNGDGDVDGHFEGFIPKFEADASVIKVVGTEITQDNVVEEIQKLLNAVPKGLRRQKDLVLAVSIDVETAYENKLINAGILNGMGGEGNPLKIGKRSLEAINGLPDNTMVVYRKPNLKFGTGLEADFNEVRIKDMDETDLSGMIRYKMVYSAGTQYHRGDQIVFYSPAATPSV